MNYLVSLWMCVVTNHLRQRVGGQHSRNFVIQWVNVEVTTTMFSNWVMSIVYKAHLGVDRTQILIGITLC